MGNPIWGSINSLLIFLAIDSLSHHPCFCSSLVSALAQRIVLLLLYIPELSFITLCSSGPARNEENEHVGGEAYVVCFRAEVTATPMAPENLLCNASEEISNLTLSLRAMDSISSFRTQGSDLFCRLRYHASENQTEASKTIYTSSVMKAMTYTNHKRLLSPKATY